MRSKLISAVTAISTVGRKLTEVTDIMYRNIQNLHALEITSNF